MGKFADPGRPPSPAHPPAATLPSAAGGGRPAPPAPGAAGGGGENVPGRRRDGRRESTGQDTVVHASGRPSDTRPLPIGDRPTDRLLPSSAFFSKCRARVRARGDGPPSAAPPPPPPSPEPPAAALGLLGGAGAQPAGRDARRPLGARGEAREEAALRERRLRGCLLGGVVQGTVSGGGSFYSRQVFRGVPD